MNGNNDNGGRNGVGRDNDDNHDEDDRMMMEVVNEIGNINIDQQQPQHQQQQQPDPIAGAGWENQIPAMLVDHPAVVAFQASNASFLVTDPRLPGNPIIYASDVSCEKNCKRIILFVMIS
jgi:hypothetical protein